MMKVEKIDLTNLPSDVASNIASFVVGNPEDVRLKHNKTLKKIQRKYKPYYTEEEREEYEYFRQMFDCSEVDMKGVIIKYELIQNECAKPLFHYIKQQYEKIKNIIDKEIEEQVNKDFDIFDIHLSIRRQYKDDREYYDRNLDIRDRQEQWGVSCNSDENFNYTSLKNIIERKQYVESELYTNEDEGAVVSSYEITISLDFQSF